MAEESRSPTPFNGYVTAESESGSGGFNKTVVEPPSDGRRAARASAVARTAAAARASVASRAAAAARVTAEVSAAMRVAQQTWMMKS